MNSNIPGYKVLLHKVALPSKEISLSSFKLKGASNLFSSSKISKSDTKEEEDHDGESESDEEEKKAKKKKRRRSKKHENI